jgi:hypothetical protein
LENRRGRIFPAAAKFFEVTETAEFVTAAHRRDAIHQSQIISLGLTA